ncbi:hypothetical protein D3C78_1715780 [compost metagenome]
MWVEQLAGIDGNRALRNLNRHIAESTFFPTVADIIRLADDPDSDIETLRLETSERFAALEEWEQRATPPPTYLLKRGGRE